jgi:hypothetical protein
MTEQEDNWFVVATRVRNISEKESVQPIAQAFVDKVVELCKQFSKTHQVEVDIECGINQPKSTSEEE